MKKIYYLISCIIVLQFLSITCLGQERHIDNPGYLKSIQGIWANVDEGSDVWLKIEIKGNQFRYFSAQPKDGQWNEMPTCLIDSSTTVINKYRSNYDGKLKTEVYSYAIVRHDPSTTSDNLILKGKTKSGRTYIYWQSTEKQFTGEFNTEGLPILKYFVSSKFFKKPSNFNPWR